MARTTRRTATRGAPTLAQARRTIATEKLVKRLTDHALGKAEMSSTQVSAAFGLLKKTLPDLGTLAVGDDDASPVVEIKVRIVDPRS